MTPYDLEESARRRQKRLDEIKSAPAGVNIVAFLTLVFEGQQVILQHLADVEGEANLDRANR